MSDQFSYLTCSVPGFILMFLAIKVLQSVFGLLLVHLYIYINIYICVCMYLYIQLYTCYPHIFNIQHSSIFHSVIQYYWELSLSLIGALFSHKRNWTNHVLWSSIMKLFEIKYLEMHLSPFKCCLGVFPVVEVVCDGPENI
jgi:hypothetical protein